MLATIPARRLRQESSLKQVTLNLLDNLRMGMRRTDTRSSDRHKPDKDPHGNTPDMTSLFRTGESVLVQEQVNRK